MIDTEYSEAYPRPLPSPTNALCESPLAAVGGPAGVRAATLDVTDSGEMVALALASAGISSPKTRFNSISFLSSSPMKSREYCSPVKGSRMTQAAWPFVQLLHFGAIRLHRSLRNLHFWQAGRCALRSSAIAREKRWFAWFCAIFRGAAEMRNAGRLSPGPARMAARGQKRREILAVRFGASPHHASMRLLSVHMTEQPYLECTSRFIHST
jgi:hypothetical protein